MYPLRSLTRSPVAVAPAAECARLRPMTTPPSSSSSETGTSAGVDVVVVAVVIVLAGMTKYRPIALRTAAFAAPPIPPPSSAPGEESLIRWLGIGDCFLYYTPQQGKKKRVEEEKISSTDSSNKGKGEWEKEKGNGKALDGWRSSWENGKFILGGWRERSGQKVEWR